MSEFTVYSVPGSPFGRAVLATLEEKAASYRLLPVVPGTFRSPASSSPSSLSARPFAVASRCNFNCGEGFFACNRAEQPVGQGHGRFANCAMME